MGHEILSEMFHPIVAAFYTAGVLAGFFIGFFGSFQFLDPGLNKAVEKIKGEDSPLSKWHYIHALIVIGLLMWMGTPMVVPLIGVALGVALVILIVLGSTLALWMRRKK